MAVVYTIGYGDNTFAAVAERLAQHGITTIVDVRAIAQFPDEGEFAQSEIVAISSESGLGYRWVGDRIREPDDAELLEGAIDEIAGLTQTSTVALLCAELEPELCHRATTLAPRLIDRGYGVVHIRADGSGTPHEDDMGW